MRPGRNSASTFPAPVLRWRVPKANRATPRPVALVALLLAAVAAAGCGGSLSPRAPRTAYDAVVIGSGGGGLAAATLLARRGMKVVLLEQGAGVGGYMTAFERPPYTFEVSLHTMDGLNEGGRSRLLFERLGILDRVEPVRLSTAYRAVFPDFAIDVPADAGAYRAELERLFPSETRGIGEFFAAMADMYTAVEWKNRDAAGDRKGAGLVVSANKSFWTVFLKYGHETFAGLLDDCTRDPKLRAVLSWLCGYIGASPSRIPALPAMAMWASYHRDGFYYFRGGSRSISEALADAFLEAGGEIQLGARATGIEIADGRAAAVVVQGGTRFPCRYVVSNASARATLLEMIGRAHLPRAYVRELERMRVGPSLFQVFLGVDHDYTPQFGGAHTISVSDSYDPDSYLGTGPHGADPEALGFYLTDFSVVDPLAAPQGKNAIEITTYLPYGWQDGWRARQGDGAYEALKEKTAAVFVRRAEKLLPGLSTHVEVMEIGTPRTMERFTLNPGGAVYGWAAGESMGRGMFPMDRRTPIPNVYLASAWSAGGGQSNVLAVGVNVADDILAGEAEDAPRMRRSR
jgi:all-trans-retinol 13,14-reductase